MNPANPRPAVPRFAPSALVGLGFAVAGFVVVIFGAYLVPDILRAAAPPEGSPPRNLVAFWYTITYGLPLALGLAGAWLGAHAMGEIDHSGGRLVGDDPAVFAIMIGLFTALTAAILIAAYVVWPVLIAWRPGLGNVM